MSWVSWEKLSHPKGYGGLGFRDIESFNNSLLAKISWRIYKFPHSLLARFLLSKYCQDQSFLECEAPPKASYGWKSILAGRDFMRTGMGWLVGTGSNIHLWTEPWLSTTQPTAPIGPPPEHLQHLRVSDIIVPATNQWDLVKIREVIPAYETAIQLLPRSSLPREDKLVWLYEKSGNYSSRSGYNFATTRNISRADSNFKWHHQIWNIKATPKVKTFMWRACLNSLPVRAQLVARHITENSSCPRCGTPETVDHVLIHCPYAQSVWSMAPCENLDIHPNSTIRELLPKAKQTKLLPPSGLNSASLYPWLLWRLWNARNSLIFSNHLISEADTLLLAHRDALSWQTAHPPSFEDQPPVHEVRTPPTPPATTRINCDAAWNSSTKNCGIGYTIADAGNQVSTFKTALHHVASPLAAEALAIKFSLLQARSKGIQQVQLLSDSLTLTTLLAGHGNHVDIFGILDDIRDLQSCFTHLSFIYIPRTVNSVADSLAKEALSCMAHSIFT